MLVPINELESIRPIFIPFFSLLIGLGGGLHWIGMCGGIQFMATRGKGANFIYQFGRLTGYLSIAGLFYSFGDFFLGDIAPIINFIFSFSLFLFFIYFGIRVFKKTRTPFAGHFNEIYSKLSHGMFNKVLGLKKGNLKAFFVGTASVFLPCGLFYSMAFTIMAFTDFKLSFLAIVSFWLGTLPAMVFGPELAQKFLFRYISKSPRLTGSILILIGLLSFAPRVHQAYQASFHTNLEKKSCH